MHRDVLSFLDNIGHKIDGGDLACKLEVSAHMPVFSGQDELALTFTEFNDGVDLESKVKFDHPVNFSPQVSIFLDTLNELLEEINLQTIWHTDYCMGVKTHLSEEKHGSGATFINYMTERVYLQAQVLFCVKSLLLSEQLQGEPMSLQGSDLLATTIMDFVCINTDKGAHMVMH